MKKLNIFILSILFVSCQSAKKTDGINTVTFFPVQQKLTAGISKLSNPILMSRVMFVSGNYLYLYKEKDSTLFDVFELPECDYYCSTSIKGGGPDDFLLFDPRSFRPTEQGFEAMEAGTHLLKSVVLQNKALKNEKTRKVFEGFDSTNGFYLLKNDTYLSFGSINGENEFRFINLANGKCTDFGVYPMWTKINVEQPFQRFVTYMKSCAVCPDGSRFAVFYVRFKKFRIFTDKGVLVKEVDVKVQPYTSDIVPDFKEQMFYYMAQPVAVGNYIYVLCGNRKESDHTTLDPKNELQVWDWEGNSVACYQLDHSISSYAISEKYSRMYAFNSLIDNEIYIYDLPRIHKEK